MEGSPPVASRRPTGCPRTRRPAPRSRPAGRRPTATSTSRPWVDEGTKRTVTYGRLPAGRSTFQVTAVDESELTSVSPAQPVIVREPAPYERGSIQLLSAAVL